MTTAPRVIPQGRSLSLTLTGDTGTLVITDEQLANIHRHDLEALEAAIWAEVERRPDLVIEWQWDGLSGGTVVRWRPMAGAS